MQDHNKKSALVIGGSGMLAGLSIELAKSFKTLGVLGRSKSKIDRLNASNIIPITLDYTNLRALKDSLSDFVSVHGKPELVVSWIHSTSPDATPIVAQFCAKNFYEITGHSGAKTNHLSYDHEKLISNLGVNYHRVILAKNGSRWLNNTEISQGVLDAISKDLKQYIVGNL